MYCFHRNNSVQRTVKPHTGELRKTKTGNCGVTEVITAGSGCPLEGWQNRRRGLGLLEFRKWEEKSQGTETQTHEEGLWLSSEKGVPWGCCQASEAQTDIETAGSDSGLTRSTASQGTGRLRTSKTRFQIPF